ncbi:uncharacterized protein LOC114724440 [Neltuma alba]|uniref:uncharacterized protein LOC114724440 n=1 Tax=Neltuma alba TaxID=207710 RepID=UPI0010A4FEBC|nr:uncharacterized protein LOC114724440 [Prosopis alba]
MANLYFLDVRSTRIKKIPLSIIHLINLRYLDVSDCNMLKSMPELPPNLIISASYCPLLKLTTALVHLYDSRVFKGPIHVFYDYMYATFLWKSGVPRWFKEWKHCRSKGNSGEVVTITANIPENAYSDNDCWEIAICVVFSRRSDDEAWSGFSINWKFQDYCDANPHNNGMDEETMRNFQFGRLRYRVYVGAYPIDKEHCRPHPTGVGSQVDLTLCFPTPSIAGWNQTRYQYFEVLECWWSVQCKTEFGAR